MAPLPVVSGRCAVHVFEKAGWKIARQKGSQISMVKAGHTGNPNRPYIRPVSSGNHRGLIRMKHLLTIEPKRRMTMTNEEFQMLVLRQLARMEDRIGKIEEGQARMETRMDRLEKSQDILATEVMDLKSKTNDIDTKLTRLAVRLENEIEPKINALFEGHKQHTEQLTRIEEQVNKHDEYILKRIK
jgi:hypothetical protein